MADPPDQSAKSRRWKWRIVLLVVVALIATGFSYLAWRFTRDDPVTYKDPEEHFKYGSTGGERESGIPYWIWKVLPKMFPEYLPGKTFTPGTEYASLGFLYESGKDLPIGEIYLPSDPPRAFKVISATKKPCLVYKVLAAGRRVGNKAEVKGCLQTALENVKPTDALIVGMYQQFGDQVGSNTALVRELCAKRS